MMNTKNDLPCSLGRLTLAVTLIFAPVAAWPDHGPHDHNFC